MTQPAPQAAPAALSQGIIAPTGKGARPGAFGVEGRCMTQERKWRRIEPGLYELPAGADGKPRYAAEWLFRGRKIRRRFRTVTLARQALYAVRGQIVEGRYIDRKQEVKTTFEDAVKWFLEWSKVNTRPSTSRRDRTLTKNWLEHFKGKTLDTITTGDIERFKMKEAARCIHGTDRPIKLKTVDISIARLKRLFSLAVENGMCKENPALKVKLFRPESRRDRFLSPDEANALIDQATEPTRAAIVFSLHTGLRLGEMLSLTWGQVDFKQGQHGQVTVTAERAKGKRSRRVPLDETARAALDSLPRGIGRDTLVFQVFGGSYNSTLRKSFEKAKAAAELEGVCWHTLRHSFASWLVMAGTPLITVQKLLGHSTFEMVLRYAHLAPGYLEEAVTVLDAFGKKTVNITPTASGGGNP